MHDDNMEGTNVENLSSHEVITVKLRSTSLYKSPANRRQ